MRLNPQYVGYVKILWNREKITINYVNYNKIFMQCTPHNGRKIYLILTSPYGWSLSIESVEPRGRVD